MGVVETLAVMLIASFVGGVAVFAFRYTSHFIDLIGKINGISLGLYTLYMAVDVSSSYGARAMRDLIADDRRGEFYDRLDSLMPLPTLVALFIFMGWMGYVMILAMLASYVSSERSADRSSKDE
ncbi:hypothetical protein M2A_3127 [Tepidicaulis marinus]|uniref:Uncharacterized protein n=1 Tax=Tepidicaulis marinus TaxID=1333998 RepID=A0A081BF10_9HYPH|nr:hypothetical protein [Tepidicaulis marinus]GAK46628.1 hypothetical protein M2A_3127 [Tepidicaulis marinus]